MNRLIFESYRRAFPELEYIIENSSVQEGSRRYICPKALQFISISGLEDLPREVVLSDLNYRSKLSDSMSESINELWAVSEGIPTRIKTKNDEKIGEALLALGLRNVDYFLLSRYHHSYTFYPHKTFSPATGVRLPGDMDTSRDFWIGIYESADHRKNRSPFNKAIDSSLSFLRRI